MIIDDIPLAISIFALDASRYLLRIPLVLAAFFTAINVDKVITRALALGFLVVLGILFLSIGIGNKTVGDILIGIGAIAAAIYAWWSTKV